MLRTIPLTLLSSLLILLHPARCPGQEGVEPKAFLAAVHSGEPARVMELFHPRLRAEVDEPVLSRWMEAVRNALGPLEGSGPGAFQTANRAEKSLPVLEIAGTVRFEKGEGRLRLGVAEGKILSFDLQSDRLPKEWFLGPLGTKLYHERGKECLALLFKGEVEKALGLFAEDLRGEGPWLAEVMASWRARLGALESVTFASESYEKKTLEIEYRLAFESSKDRSLLVSARIVFGFSGFKGWIRDGVLQAPVPPLPPEQDRVAAALARAEAFAGQDRLADALELLEKTRGKLFLEGRERLELPIAALRLRIENARRESVLRGEFEILKKFEEFAPIRQQRLAHMVFEFLYRVGEFRRDNPLLPADIEAALKEWEAVYSGVVDMNSEPDPGWVTPLIRGPIGRSQHYKRPDIALKRMADLKLRYRGAAMQEHLAQLEEELMRIVNLFGRREVELAEEMIARGDSHLPRLNEQLRDLRWMIDTVGLPEWQQKGKAALEKLLAHRDAVRRKQAGGEDR